MKHPLVAPILFVWLASLVSFAQTSPAVAQFPKSSAAKVSRAQTSPVLTLSASKTAPSPGETVRFTATWDRDMPQMTYHFDFGDGQSADTQEVIADHAYSTAGTYTARASGRAFTRTAVMLPSYSSNDVSIQVTQAAVRHVPLDARKIKVPPQNIGTGSSPAPPVTPTLTLSTDTVSPQINQSVHFIGTWTQNIHRMQYIFAWGDGQSTASREPVADHAYSQPGTYTVRLSATSLSPTLAARVAPINSNEVVITVTQPAPPVVPRLALSADNLNPQAGDMLRFTGRWLARKFPPSSYRFDWGDGQISDTTSLIAQHSYGSAGSYRVRVTAIPLTQSGTEVVSNELLLTVAQRPTPPPATPSLTLSADLLAPLPNQRVHFNAAWDHSVSDARYQFVWGDGQSTHSDSADAFHSYSSPGRYTVNVIARGLANDRYFDRRSNEVTIAVATPSPPPEKPTATLQADHHNARIGEDIHFTASVSPQSSPLQYHFVFGDGNTQDSLSSEVNYSYRRAGDFRPWVTVTVQTQDAPVTSPAIQLVVSNLVPSAGRPPRLGVALKTKKLLVGKDVVLQASLDPPHDTAAYEFDWGDGSVLVRVASHGVASHRYAQKGRYLVLVTASTGEVYPAPIQQSLIIVISRPFWPFTLLEWIVIMVGAGAAVKTVQVVRNRWNKPPPPKPQFHVRGSVDAGVHAVTRVDHSIPHLSITLKPRMDLAEHEITFRKRAAASD